MKLIADYHTHSTYSNRMGKGHGKGTIRENVEAARKKGLKEIAITDHGPSHIGYGVTVNSLKKMRKEIDELNKEYDDIKILLGVEANIIGYDGTIDIDDTVLKYLDILVVGFHFGTMPKSIKDGYKMFVQNFLGKFSDKTSKKIRDKNTDALINAINKYDIFFISHPGAKVDVDTNRLAKAAAKRNTALEINSSHGYLTVEYIKIAMKENVNFVINSDAHHPDHIGLVTKGFERAKEAGLSVDKIINVTE